MAKAKARPKAKSATVIHADLGSANSSKIFTGCLSFFSDNAAAAMASKKCRMELVALRPVVSVGDSHTSGQPGFHRQRVIDLLTCKSIA